MVQGSNGSQSSGVDILEDVSLASFGASPQGIRPFGASLLSWQVTGPKAKFSVVLNGATVVQNGEQIVQPTQTTPYRLSAVAAGATKFLGMVTVTVDELACQTNSLFNPSTTIKGFLNGNIGSQPGITLQGNPEVDFSPGMIKFTVKFSVPYGGDAFIYAELWLRISDGHITSVAQFVTSDVSFPNYIELAALFSSSVSKQIADGRASVSAAARDLVTGLGELLDFLAVFPHKFVKHRVSIGVDEQGHGTIDVQACPNDLLIRLSEMSAIGE